MTSEPRVWLLVGDRPGDNRQAEAVAVGLGWPFERKYLCVRDEYASTKPEVVSSVHHLDLERTDPLEAPWPDLVITMGRRLSMVALYIRDHSDRATKLVLVGKPSGMPDEFDLIVCSAENPLPRRPNVLPVELPLLRCDEAELQAAAKLWEPRLAAMPRPLLALLVGGPTKPFRFADADARRLIDRTTRLASELSAGLFVTTSPRTPRVFEEILRAGLRAGDELHGFSAGSADNPYLGLLALADYFVVTADSISMLVEVARLGKPLALYPLEVGRPGLKARLSRRLAGRILSSTADDRAISAFEPLAYALYRAGRIRHARDFGAIHDVLVRRGSAVHFGEPFPKGGQTAPDELPRVASRIRSLMSQQEP